MFKAKEHAQVFAEIDDHSQTFPEKAIQLLIDFNLMTTSIPSKYREAINGATSSSNILGLLFEIGRADLSVARIFEGHINALLLIDKFGSIQQKREYFTYANNDSLFGIWNTEKFDDELKIINKQGKLSLKGAKSFCSGALRIAHPIVTAKTKDGTQMAILNLDEKSNLKADWSYWNPLGMRASVSCRIDFSGLGIAPNQLLGKAGDYYKDPDFSWGAVRFSTVQLGGAKAIVDILIKELVKRERTNDPYQKMRLGELAILMESASLWIERAIKIERLSKEKYSTKKRVNFANMMRTVSGEICEKTIYLAEKSMGVQGMMKNHPMEKKVRDLRVYLKQAGPDAALANVGNFIAKENG